MNCPSDDKIAGFVDGLMPQDEMDNASQHFANCTKCLKIISAVKKTEYLRSTLSNQAKIKLVEIERPKLVKLVLLPVACCLVGFIIGFLILSTLFANNENPTIIVKEFTPTGELAFISYFPLTEEKPLIGNKPANLLQAIYPGQTIEGTVKLSFIDGTEVSLNKSKVEFVSAGLWRLRKGELWTRRNQKNGNINIETENGIVHVGITELTLSVDEEKTDVNVYSGSAKVKDNSSEQDLNQGMSVQMKKHLPFLLKRYENSARPGWLRRLANVFLRPNERKEFWFRSFENSNEDDWHVDFNEKRARFSCKKHDESRVQIFAKAPFSLNEPLEIEFRVIWPELWRPWKGAFIIKNKEIGELRLAFRKRSIHLVSIERGRKPVELDKMKMNKEEYLVKIRLEKDKISLWINDKLRYQDSTRLGEMDQAFLGFVLAGSQDEVIIEDFKISHLTE